MNYKRIKKLFLKHEYDNILDAIFMSNYNPRIANPTEMLYKAINTPIQIKVKRNQQIGGILKSFDSHMNVLLENVTYSYSIPDEANEGNYKVVMEELPSVLVRGDNIVFIEYKPNASE
jgi:small nuclear ribonucleoprotein